MIGQSLLRKPGEPLVCYCPPGVCQAPRGFRGPCRRASDVLAEAEAEYASWRPVARASLSEYAQSQAGFLLVGKADFHMSAEMDVCIGDELFIRRTRPAAPGAGQEPEPVAWRVRGYNQFKTGNPRPWRYFDGAVRPKVNDPDGCDMEPLYAAAVSQSKQATPPEAAHDGN
jgi:hypothetical protein